MFHANADLPVTVEGAVETDDVRRIALVKHLELPDNLVSYGRLDLQMNQLWRKQERKAHTSKDEDSAEQLQKQLCQSLGMVGRTGKGL